MNRRAQARKGSVMSNVVSIAEFKARRHPMTPMAIVDEQIADCEEIRGLLLARADRATGVVKRHYLAAVAETDAELGVLHARRARLIGERYLEMVK